MCGKWASSVCANSSPSGICSRPPPFRLGGLLDGSRSNSIIDLLGRVHPLRLRHRSSDAVIVDFNPQALELILVDFGQLFAKAADCVTTRPLFLDG